MGSRILCTELALMKKMRRRAASKIVATLVLAAGIGAAASVPVFELDPSWPKVPAKWKLGDASSVAVDSHDNVWVLHRPRTLPADQSSLAAPPVIVFDTAGKFVKAWGGAGSGYE